MSFNFRNKNLALLLGAINGALCGVISKPALDTFAELPSYGFDQSNLSVGLMLYKTPDLYISYAILFSLASYVIHRFWASRIESTIVLWQVVAVAAMIVPAVFHKIYVLIVMLIKKNQMCLDTTTWVNFYNLEFDLRYFESSIMLLCLAMSVSFFYGAIVEKLSSRYAK